MLKTSRNEVVPYFGRNAEFHLCCSLFSSFHLAHSWIALDWVSCKLSAPDENAYRAAVQTASPVCPLPALRPLLPVP